MKLILNIIVIALTFMWFSGVYADKQYRNTSPESIMTCGGGGGNSISVLSVPASINKDECPEWVDGECATCIMSLEKQGCQVVDVIVSHLAAPDNIAATGTTYLLSCAKP